MVATLTFLGAAGTVTGSRFLLEHEGRGTLVDCGLYQGERALRRLNWQQTPVSPGAVFDVILTQSQLDHSGHLPVLVRDGFTGPTWCAEGTAEVAAIALRASAVLQEEDAQHARLGGFSRHDPPRPLFTGDDAEKAIASFKPMEYEREGTLDSGARLSFSRAGHTLGSASVLVRLDGDSILFSGDLGRPSHPLLLPPDAPAAARTVVVESTYGDRTHPPQSALGDGMLAEAIRRTVKRGGSVLIPASSVNRTDLVLHALSELAAAGDIPGVPIFVDSPLAFAGLYVHRNHPVRHDVRPDLPARLVYLPDLQMAEGPKDSTRLSPPRTPSIVLSETAMATGGRVVRHLRHFLPDARNTVILTGYQAVGTRGRRLAGGAAELKMSGRYVPVRAEVVVDPGFAVHADATELLSWLRSLPANPETVYIVHGEPQASQALAARVRAETGWAAVVPETGERVVVG